MADAPKRRLPVGWLIVSSLLALLLVLQLGLLFSGGETRKLDAMADSRDLTIDLKTGELKGSLYSPPSETSPAPATPEPAAPVPQAAPEAPLAEGVSESSSPAPATPDVSVRQPLRPAPNPALVEQIGPLSVPRIGPDKTTPAAYYAKPLGPDAEVARIAVVLDGVGLNRANLDAALALDESIALAFSPYTPSLPAVMQAARQRGHEAWLNAPLQPGDYPASDGGPYALLTTDSAEQAKARLMGLLATSYGYVGLIAPPASITASQSLFGTLGEELRLRGLLFASADQILQLPQYDATRLKIDRVLPPSATPAQLSAALSDAETQARRGTPVSILVPAEPALLQGLANWSESVGTHHVSLVPLSSLKLAPATEAPAATAAHP